MTKIKVEIISPTGSIQNKNCKVIGDKVIIQKETKRKAEKSAQLDNDCVVTTGSIFKKRKAYLREDANKCIPVLRKIDKPEDVPVWDADTEEKLFDANVIKATGATTSKIQIPISVYLLLIVIVALSFITLLQVTGRIRIG